MSDDIKKALSQTALRYLGYRDRFKKEIETRLKKQIIKKKFPEDSFSLIPNILTKLEKAGLINDQELINTYIKNQQSSKLRGPFAIKQRLMQMGATKDLIDSSINKLVTEETQNINIDKLLKKHQPDLGDIKAVLKFQRLLSYRGFDSRLIKKKIAFPSQKE
jgi:regulatory protein